MKTNYQVKKALQKSGGYNGSSPFFQNIPDFQFLKPVHNYPHLKEISEFRFPTYSGDNRREERILYDTNNHKPFIPNTRLENLEVARTLQQVAESEILEGLDD